jgi:maltoporin
MYKIAKFSVAIVLAASAAVASAADLEFHGYARVGLGFNSAGGNQVGFTQNVSGKSKFRLGNEPDYCIEPSFSMSFVKLDDKSQWGVSMLPAVYRRMSSGGNPTTPALPAGAVDSAQDPYHNQADGGLPVSYKEFYFYGRNVPQLGGGEIWVGRRYFGRNYLGAINDSFLEAQDGIGAGIYDIPVGPAKLHFDVAAPGVFNNGSDAAVINTDLAPGVHVTGIPTFNKDSALQLWARAYVPMQKTSGDPKVAQKRSTGFSASAMHVSGFGSAGALTLAARFDQNGYTDQQGNGSAGRRNLEADLVYGVNLTSARTSLDVLVGWRQSKSVKYYSGQASPADDTMNLYLAGFRTDTQLSGPFRFLLEVGYDTNKTKGGKQHNLLKVTPCLALNAGETAGARPTFRLFYTYASWNKEGSDDVFAANKDTAVAFKGKTSGGTFGIQAEAGW